MMDIIDNQCIHPIYNGDIVRLDRLTRNLNVNIDVGLSWNTDRPITRNDIVKAITKGQIPEQEPFGHMHQKDKIQIRNRYYHIGRILYFIINPDQIRDIELDNECYHYYISPNVVLIDGWHRLFAAIYLNLKTVHVKYGGRIDVLDYLRGVSNNEPID